MGEVHTEWPIQVLARNDHAALPHQTAVEITFCRPQNTALGSTCLYISSV